jgi:hypothetical protein
VPPCFAVSSGTPDVRRLVVPIKSVIKNKRGQGAAAFGMIPSDEITLDEVERITI